MSTHEEIFYGNVYLLTQIISTTDIFDSLFSKDMFRKQNTPGFLHVSHFLLNIYDASVCKKLIPWPCICKPDEAKFRKKFVEFLTIIQKENPDFQFPSTVLSCLFQATGTKFMIIMKLLSIIVLRRYIKKHAGRDVYIPSFLPEMTMDSLQDFQKLATARAQESIESFNSDQEYANEFISERKSQIEDIKRKIHEKEAALAKLIKKAPINSEEDKRKLEDYENNEDIVESWKASLLECIDYGKKGTQVIEKFSELLSQVSQIIHGFNKPVVLDGNTLPAIDVDGISSLLDPEYQIVARRLYENNELSLTNFFAILNKILILLGNGLQSIDVDTITAFSEQVGASAEDLQAMSKIFVIQQETCMKLYYEIEPHRLFGEYLDTQRDVLPPMSPVCPRLTEDEKRKHVKKINLTPTIKFHDHVFYKHKNASKCQNVNKSLESRVTRINLDDSIQSFRRDVMATQRSDRTRKPKLSRSASIAQKLPRYAGLFSVGRTSFDSSKIKEISMLSSPQANSTAYLKVNETPNICESVLEDKETTPKKRLHVPEVKTPEIVIEPPKEEQREEPVRRSRRSLADLADQHKKILQKVDSLKSANE